MKGSGSPFSFSVVEPNEEPAMNAPETWVEEISTRETTMPDVTITMVGFAEETDAQNLANILRGFLTFFGKLMNLSSLSRASGFPTIIKIPCCP